MNQSLITKKSSVFDIKFTDSTGKLSATGTMSVESDFLKSMSASLTNDGVLLADVNISKDMMMDSDKYHISLSCQVKNMTLALSVVNTILSDAKSQGVINTVLV